MLAKIGQTIALYAKTEEIRRKVFFSILILVVFRILAAVPVVGIPADALAQLFAGSNFGDLISTISGGVLETASVVAIGLSPYINASIALQLLTPVIPRLEALRKEGTQGRRVISTYTRILTIPLAIMQSFVIYSTLRGFGLMGQLTPLELVGMSATLTAGAAIVMWLGELVTEDGIGNGISYLIFLGVLSGIPATLTGNLVFMDTVQKIVFILLNVFLVTVVVLISEAERRIKVQYSRRVRTTGMTSESYIPLKLTQSGVMPVIFAISMLSFPQLIAQFFIGRGTNPTFVEYSSRVLVFLNDQYVQNIGTFVLIVLFSFLYITIVFNTDEIAENLQKQGGFILGIRPGKSTSKYLRAVSFRLTAVGALVLAVLSILPNILLATGFIQTTLVSGTGLLIAVGVVLEIRRQLQSMVVVRDYDRYI